MREVDLPVYRQFPFLDTGKFQRTAGVLNLGLHGLFSVLQLTRFGEVSPNFVAHFALSSIVQPVMNIGKLLNNGRCPLGYVREAAQNLETTFKSPKHVLTAHAHNRKLKARFLFPSAQPIPTKSIFLKGVICQIRRVNPGSPATTKPSGRQQSKKLESPFIPLPSAVELSIACHLQRSDA